MNKVQFTKDLFADSQMEINSYKFHVGKDRNSLGSFGLENHGEELLVLCITLV